jgi:hypothetical protein
MRVAVISLVVALLVLPSLGTPSVLASPLRVTQVTVKDLDNRLVVGIVATGQILFNVTEISNPRPPRVAIDILNAVADERIRGTSEVNKGNVLRVRVGQFQDSPAIARIVVDLARPIRVQVHLTSPTVLTVSLPLQQATEGDAEAVPPPAPVPTRLGVAAPAAGAAPGTGLIRTAQPLPPPPLPGGTSSGPGVLRLVEFRGVALADVLTAFAKLCGFNLVTDGSIGGTITLRLLDVTCEEALRFVLETNNLGYRRLGKNLIVGAADKLAPPPEVPETIAYRLSFGDPNQIRAAVAAAVPGVRVAVDVRTNALLITGTSAQHEEVVKVLGTLDVRIPQVVIQVHVVEIGTTYVKTLGLFGGTGTALGPGTFGTVAVDSANNRLTFTLQSTTLFFFQLQALVNEGKARVVTAPRVATLDGNKATIVLGQQVPIFTSVTVGGQLQTTVTYQAVGVQLETTPRVNSDSVITLALKPSVSSLGAPQSSGGQTAFIINTRSADTQLSVQDGKTIVLGGLISRDERLTTIKVPVLGDIPILGEMFKNTNSTITESELIFLITPQIVKD